MGSTMQFRIDPLERELVERVARNRGVSASKLIRDSIRKEVGSSPRGQLHATLSPAIATSLLDKAARMGRTSDELVEALIRDHLDGLTSADLNDDERRARARERARELLNG